MPAAAVLGTGLIGTSLGIALRNRGWTVTGWDPDPASLARASAMAALDRVAGSAGEALGGAELVMLAGPVTAIVESLPSLDTDALVSDVAGVKAPVVAAAYHLRRFVGGHPMAGRETSGPEGASGSMFRGATWVLTEDGAADEDLEAMSRIVEGFEAVPVVMRAADHDAAVAAASHLPHLAAAALVEVVGRDGAAMALAAGGFRDLTRIAMSDPSWWVDVLVANGKQVGTALRSLAASLDDLAERVEAADRSLLLSRLSESRRLRSAMAAPVETVGVLLDDRPGEIARVGHALAESGVDLRDLQLRHAVHGGAGVLTLSVRSAEVDRLRGALLAEGFRLAE